jgi:hypothetical protein
MLFIAALASMRGGIDSQRLSIMLFLLPRQGQHPGGNLVVTRQRLTIPNHDQTAVTR